MQIIYENNNYRITYEKGDNDILVIAFAGIELKLGSIQKEEFQKTLKSSNKNNHICYVIDKQRSWYNFIEAEITNHLNKLIENIGVNKVITLGNSMGGYGAIIFACKLNKCKLAIAFCPQFSINPEIIPFETRWQQYRDRITKFSTPNISTEISEGVNYNIFFGNLEKRDKKHKDLFKALNLNNLHITTINGASHNVAGFLKEKGELAEVILNLIDS